MGSWTYICIHTEIYLHVICHHTGRRNDGGTDGGTEDGNTVPPWEVAQVAQVMTNLRAMVIPVIPRLFEGPWKMPMAFCHVRQIAWHW